MYTQVRILPAQLGLLFLDVFSYDLNKLNRKTQTFNPYDRIRYG